MPRRYRIEVVLIDPARVAHAAPPVPGEPAPEVRAPKNFSADADAAESDAVAARNLAIEARLMARLPGFEPKPGWRAEMSELFDDELSVEAMLRRHQRVRAGQAPWAFGECEVELYDDLALATVIVSRHEPPRGWELQHEFAALLAALTEATGFVPWDPGLASWRNHAGVPLADPAEELLYRHEAGLEWHWQAVRLDRNRPALGFASLVVLTLLAALVVAGLLGHGVRRGTLMAGVDASSPAIFTTEALAPVTSRFGLIPQFTLVGRVGHSWLPVHLPVFRDEYIAAGLGAQFPVLPSSDPATPYVLRRAQEDAGQILRLGSIGVAWPALLALLPATLWLAYVAWPLWRAPVAMRGAVKAGMTGTLARLLGIMAVAALAFGLRVVLQP
jgi:hypothetical protein